MTKKKIKGGVSIKTRLAGNMVTCKFLVDRPLHKNGPHFFRDKSAARCSPLALKIMNLDGILSVKINGDTVAVTRGASENWPAVTRPVARIITDHVRSKEPAVEPGVPSNIPSDKEIRKKVAQVLKDQVNPSVSAHGGVITLIGVKDATVLVKLGGGCTGCGMARVTLRQGVEQALRSAIPEIDEVRDVTDHATGTDPYYSPSGE